MYIYYVRYNKFLSEMFNSGTENLEIYNYYAQRSY